MGRAMARADLQLPPRTAELWRRGRIPIQVLECFGYTVADG